MSPAPTTSKQPSLWKEFLALICLMLFLALVGFGLAWYKGHTIWQPDIEESRLIIDDNERVT